MVKKFAEEKTNNAFTSGMKLNKQVFGSSGTEIFGGFYSEEYLANLRGMDAAKIWDRMRRSETQIAMLLLAVTNPIKSANWYLESFSEDEIHVNQKDLIEAMLFDQIDFSQFMHECLTMIPFGHAVFEVVHNVVFNHPKFKTFNGLAALAFRNQKTILAWNLEKKTGKLLSVEQQAFGDVADNAVIPGDFCLVFSNLKEGDNLEGISALRPMYGAYSRKDLYLKLTAIGVEKYAIGTPIGTIPAGKEKSSDVENFKKVLESFVAHETAYVTKPEGWTIDIQKTEFDAGKIVELLKFENTEMINAMVANFLALGTGGNGGAFALGQDLSDFFLSGLESYARIICDVINRQLIPNLIKSNFGEQEGYPKLKFSGISDKAGKELMEIVVGLIGGQALKPDEKLEEFLRKQYNLPKAPKVEDVAVQTQPQPLDATKQMQFSETIKLADTYLKDFDKNKALLKDVMQKELLVIYEGLKEDIKKAYTNASDAEKNFVVVGMQARGRNNYRAKLEEILAKSAYDAIENARGETPKKVKGLKLAEPRGGYFEALPPHVKKLVKQQAALVSQTQVSDIEKATYLQFASSANSTESIDQILTDIDSKALGTEGLNIKSMSIDAAAGDAVAQVVSQARLEWFFAPEVFDTIESFTFTNEDPVSDICKELNGTVFAPNDPNLDRYSPPLHHNCKSRLVPNLKGASNNPEIDRGDLSLTKKALNAITLKE